MTELGNISDIELITECYGEARELAFAALHARYNKLVKKFVASLNIVQKHEVDDVLQLTWYKVSGNLHSFDFDKGSFKVWLFQVAKRCACNMLRYNKRQKRGGLETILSLEDCCADMSVDHRTGRCARTPDEILNSKEELKIAIDAIEHLPQPEQEVMMYVYLVGLSFKETGEIMGEQPAVLRARSQRVREKLNRKVSLV